MGKTLTFLLSLSAAAGAPAQMAPSTAEVAAYRGIHAAVAASDLAGIKRLVADGVDLNARDAHGRTVLMVAAYNGNERIAEALIRNGADVNAFDSQHYDLLTIAAVANDLLMLELALRAGADPGAVTSPYEGTALIAAAHLGHVEIVQMLIEAGAPLDHVNNLRWTALIEAIILGDGGARHRKIVSSLIEAGADLDLADGKGTTPLGLAREYGYREIERLLSNAGASP